MVSQEIEKILEDKNYVLKLLNSKSPEKLREILLGKNIEISLKEAEDIILFVESHKNDEEALKQIDPETLHNVSGGKKASYYISRPTYYLGYGIGKVPMLGIIAYNMVKGAIDQLKGKI